MRNKPTASSLGLTKSTCDDMFRPGGHVWFKVCNGSDKFWYSNGHVAMNQSPGDIFKGGVKDANKFIWHGDPISPTYDVANLITTSGDDTLRIGAEVERRPDTEKIQSVELHGPDYVVCVQTKYIELVRYVYPEATFKGYSSLSAVRVILDGDVVAVVMPFRP